MKKIEVYITSKSLSRSYNVSIEDEFASIFVKELKEISNDSKFLDAKDLLNAYVEKSYQKFLLEKQLKTLVSQIEGIDK